MEKSTITFMTDALKTAGKIACGGVFAVLRIPIAALELVGKTIWTVLKGAFEVLKCAGGFVIGALTFNGTVMSASLIDLLANLGTMVWDLGNNVWQEIQSVGAAALIGYNIDKFVEATRAATANVSKAAGEAVNAGKEAIQQMAPMQVTQTTLGVVKAEGLPAQPAPGIAPATA